MSMMKKVFIVLVALIIIGSIFGYKLYQNELKKKAQASFTPPPVTVSVAKSQSVNWQPYISSVGTLVANEGIDVMPQVSGIVNKINFNSGQTITVGQPIISLDTSVLKAQLENAEADMDMKKATYKRYDQLRKKQYVSDATFDLARSEYNQAVATVDEIKAQIAQMTIYAPFSGKLGIRNVNLGEYLSPGTAITNLQSIDPILVNFTIPSPQLISLYVNQPISISSDAFPNKTFNGKVVALDARMDNNTRSLLVQGEIPNSTGELYPGLYVTINVLLPQKNQTIVIPQEAVTYTLYGNTVFIVQQSSDNKTIVKQQVVTVGERRGELVAITKGLQANQLVVKEGQLKLQNDMSVKVVDSKGQTS